MRSVLLLFIWFLINYNLQAQDDYFPFGKITHEDFAATFNKDTTVGALVLREFGESFIDNDNNHNLIHRYHVKLKILKASGLSRADVVIPLYKNKGYTEKLRNVKATCFNYENGFFREAKLNEKNVYTENVDQHYDLKKFAIPSVKVGSVIEYSYEFETPFFYSSFKSWNFQSELPKISSEYWATIPANYRYNISLRGVLQLAKNENKVLKEHFTPGGGRKADCVRYMWAMKDIPPFIDEDFMTAKRNFLSAIFFELEQVEYFDGRVDKVTREWKDADQELRLEERFGVQIKRGKDILDNHIDNIVGNETNPLIKAQKIYDFVRNWYKWNENYGKYSELGIKKAFDKKEGNVGDINLSLIAALKYAGLNVEPMLLATREKGIATELFPVLNDFNYVVAKLNLDEKSILLDATDDFVAFGLLPERCLNGKGRVQGEKSSYWYEIKPTEKTKQLRLLNLKLDENGLLKGSVQNVYSGYKNAEKRRQINSFSGLSDYIKDLDNRWTKVNITNYEYLNLTDVSKPLTENLTVEVLLADLNDLEYFLFNPYLLDTWERNPFRSVERTYPVDFGTAIDDSYILNLEYPSRFYIEEIPSRIALALPESGGRFIADYRVIDNRLTFSSSLIISRPIFTSVEYHYLKELFNNVVSTSSTDIMFKKRGK